eukprot:1152016-Pelagomonas_calceolata.AAC.1
MARLVEGMGSIDSPTNTQEDCAKSDLGTLRLSYNSLCCCCEASSWLPGWSCAASYLFVTSHIAEYPILGTH